jgi:geranylgeranyl pyrophosphate synthase
MTTTTESLQTELQQIENRIRSSDEDAVHARWESGRHLITLRGGKKFRHGVAAALADTLGVHRSELTARIKFATKFATEEQLTTAISQFRCWWAIKQHALTDTPRCGTSASRPKATPKEQTGSRTLQRVLHLVEDLDPTTFAANDDEVLAQIADQIDRLRIAIGTLKVA